MRSWPHGVSVLSVDFEGDRIGLTVSSLVSLSLEPPLVGVSVGSRRRCYELLRRAGAFAVSLLGADQEGSRSTSRAACRRSSTGKGIATREGPVAPLIEGAIGWVECAHARRARRRRPHALRRRSRSRSSAGRRRRSLVYRETEYAPSVIDAVVFDLDGLLIDSEEVWDEVREELRRRARWTLRRRGAARDDGHELRRVVALPARHRRRPGRARRDQRRDRAADAGALPRAPAADLRARSRRSSGWPRAGRSGSRRRRTVR